ncbi:MAG: hypothetical protein ACYCZR_10265 [Burkholderiales bacterium]
MKTDKIVLQVIDNAMENGLTPYTLCEIDGVSRQLSRQLDNALPAGYQ